MKSFSICLFGEKYEDKTYFVHCGFKRKCCTLKLCLVAIYVALEDMATK